MSSSALVLTAVGFLLCAGLKPARAAMDSVTRNKATETVKYILDRRGDLRQRPKVLQKLPPPDTESFLGKLGAVEQPLGTTVQEQVRASELSSPCSPDYFKRFSRLGRFPETAAAWKLLADTISWRFSS